MSDPTCRCRRPVPDRDTGICVKCLLNHTATVIHGSEPDEPSRSSEVLRRLKPYAHNGIACRISHMIESGEDPVDALLAGVEGYVSALEASKDAMVILGYLPDSAE